MNFNKKNLGMLALVLIVVIVAEGTGLTAPPKEFIASITAKVKGFLAGIFKKQS